MTKRERWIVGLAAAVAVYGAYSLVARGLRAEPRTPPAGAEEPTAQFIAEVRSTLEALRLAPGEDLILEASLAPWAPSPFPLRDAVAVTAEAPATLHYTGYCRIGETRLAIINGREYRVGETVAVTDFLVELIEPDRVILASQGGGRRVSIALKEDMKHGRSP